MTTNEKKKFDPTSSREKDPGGYASRKFEKSDIKKKRNNEFFERHAFSWLKKIEFHDVGNRRSTRRFFAKRHVEVLPVDKVVDKTTFVPQAIIKRRVEELAKQFSTRISTGEDDFDAYKGVAFKVDDLIFTVMRYDGHPENSSTIYLPDDIKSVAAITSRISEISRYLKIAPNDLVWQRKDDPDL